MNKKSVLGIDLGTSSVKLFQRFWDGTVVKEKERYEEVSPRGWWAAITRAMCRMDLAGVEAIGLSSQVGTYIVDEKEVISWNDPIGAKELNEIKEAYTKEQFIAKISMPHPNIISYPLPRLRYIRRNYPAAQSICQPKDFICEQLTGNRVTDPYSWRGLANLNTKAYSSFFLKELEITEAMLPRMFDFTEVAGKVKKDAVLGSSLREGTPVYVVLNDFYSSLLGMGIHEPGDMFDITGTSEHLGILEDRMNPDTAMVSGPYLTHYVHYGVTGSSGAALDFGLQFSDAGKCDFGLQLSDAGRCDFGLQLSDAGKCDFGLQLSDAGKLELADVLQRKPPIFLPYLNGERAPIWDAEARGCYFGIRLGCTKEDMYYAALEGVTFSLYHIYEKMGKPKVNSMCTAGGAAVNRTLGQLKAEMFGIPVKILKENDTSALGACMVAELGIGRYQTLREAVEKSVQVQTILEPTGKKALLEKRFELYKDLYPALKQSYESLANM